MRYGVGFEVGAVAFALLTWVLGCMPKAEPEARWQVFPLAAFKHDAEDVVATGALAARWIDVAGRHAPVVGVGSRSRLGRRVEQIAGARIQTGYDLRSAGSERREPSAARFMVTVTPEGGERTVLFEDRISGQGHSGEIRRVALEVPPELEGPGVIALEVMLDGDPGPGRALWIDPKIAVRFDAPPRQGAPRTPILLVTADTTRQDVLGVYGGPARTPALDRLAADGIVLQNVYSVGYGTTPSHASMFSGSHPRDHGVYDNQTVLGDEVETLAEALLGHGYDTAAFVSARPVVRSLGLDQGFLLYDDIFGPDPESGLGHYGHHERRAERTVDRFVQWLEAAGEPSAAWVHFFDPHQPYAPPHGAPPGEAARITELFTTEDGTPRYLKTEKLLEERRGSSPDTISLVSLDRAARRRYVAEVEALDGELGRILARLEEKGLYEEALIVFISDHGENFLSRGPQMAFKHGGLFHDVTRLAMIVKLPQSRQAGQTSDLLVANSDLPCLVLDVLDLPTPTAWTCRSFRGHFAEESSGRAFRRHVVMEGSSRQEIAVRTNSWLYREALPGTSQAVLHRLGYEEGARAMLFDLESDPEETRNVLSEPRNRAVRARFQTLARDFLDQAAATSNRALESEEHLEALKALGYVD